MTPIGKGQRGLIVSPPRAGKTILLEHMTTAVRTNNPDVHVIMLLVDERPEEVTHFKRATGAEVLETLLKAMEKYPSKRELLDAMTVREA